MKLKRYIDFNESILSKGIELLNHKEIKKNDVIAKKYIDMIYDDYNAGKFISIYGTKRKNLGAAKLALNGNFRTLWYKITPEPYGEPSSSGGSHDYTIVHLTINDLDFYNSDFTLPSATIKVTESKRGRRETEIASFIKISGSQVDKIIKFFKNEYIKKYPQLRGEEYLNDGKILHIDSELRKEKELYHKQKQEINKREWEEERVKYLDIIDKKILYNKSDMRDYFIDVEDFLVDEKVKKVFRVGYIEGNGDIYVKNTITWMATGDWDSIDKKDPLSEYTPNSIIYIIEYRVKIDDGEGIQHDGGAPIIFEEIDKIVDNDISLPPDLKIIAKGQLPIGHSISKSKVPLERQFHEYIYTIIVQQID